MKSFTTRHLYVTRNAVLGYQELAGGGFESIRRMLTTKVLTESRQDPENEECRLIEAPFGKPAYATFRVYTLADGPLLVVTKTELVQPEP